MVTIGPVRDLRHFCETISRAKNAVEEASKLASISGGPSMSTISAKLRGLPILQQALLTGYLQTISPTLLRSVLDVTRLPTRTTIRLREDLGIYPHNHQIRRLLDCSGASEDRLETRYRSNYGEEEGSSG